MQQQQQQRCKQCDVELRPDLVKHGYCLEHINKHKCENCEEMTCRALCMACRPSDPRPILRCIDCDNPTFEPRCHGCDVIDRKGVQCSACSDVFVPENRNETECKKCWNARMEEELTREMKKLSVCQKCGEEFPPTVGWDRFCSLCSVAKKPPKWRAPTKGRFKKF